MATVDIHYVKALLNCSKRKGHSIDALITEIGIPPELLNKAGARAYGEQVTQLVKFTWDKLNDEFLGCTETPCKQGVFALMACHALHYESLQAVLEQGINLYNLFTDDIQMQLVNRGDIVEFKAHFLRPELDPDHFYQEFWLVIWHRFASWVIGKKIPLIYVDFPYEKPDNFRELKYLFPCRHQFNRAELKFCFSADYLISTPVRTQRDLSRFLKNSPADLITIPGEEKSYEARIRSVLLYQKTEILTCPSFEELAAKFNISGQTLRRKLKTEGTSYPLIKDDIRRDLAIEKLCSQKLPVSEIARLLGFSEPRSFTRAFKAWTGGYTPRAYVDKKSR